MLPFIARTVLFLAAAFWLNARGNRVSRPKGGSAERRLATAPLATRQPGASRKPSSLTAPAFARSSTGKESGNESVGPAAPKQSETPLDRRTEAAVGQPAFAGYGSGFVAGVILSDAAPDATKRAGISDKDEKPTPLAAPDIHGRTPTPEQRQALPDDPLDRRHGADMLDFRTVDYGNAKAADRTAAEALFRDDGWTIPEGASLPAHGSLDDSPAAFKSGGGSGAVFGAPDGEPGEAAESGIAAGGEDAPEGALPLRSEAKAATPAEAGRTVAPDDLTRIHGIGRSIERLLFDNGIFRFSQIAGWTEAEVRWADELSGFRGRVARERWIEQAKLFEAERSAS